ncbi:MAG TPA: hypothetical protein VHE57_12905 [Mycobacteriales bacterium]|nr:hypothetical protein [Mycobacteriales bacterium]
MSTASCWSREMTSIGCDGETGADDAVPKAGGGTTAAQTTAPLAPAVTNPIVAGTAQRERRVRLVVMAFVLSLAIAAAPMGAARAGGGVRGDRRGCSCDWCRANRRRLLRRCCDGGLLGSSLGRGSLQP